MNSLKEVIILAGGAGTRLRSVVGNTPKPMAEVAGRPFLTYLLDFLVSANVSHVVLSIGYLCEQIMDYFHDNYQGMQVTYAIEDEPLGTGGAIREAFNYTSEENVLVLNGDTYFPVNLNDMMKAHCASGCEMSMALKLMHDYDRYGAVLYSEQRITGFSEKGYYSQGYINGGVYLLHRSLLDKFPPMRRFSFESDFLEPLVNQISVCPFVGDAYFIDIGIPEDYQRAQTELPNTTGGIR